MPLASFSRTVSSSSCTETAPSKRSTIFPSRPTANVQGSVWRPHSPHPAVEALRRVVVLVHLDVDEAHVAVIEATGRLLDDVHDGAARPARAELRGRERHDERRAGAERLGDRVLEERLVRRRARRQLGDVAAGRRECRRVRRRCRVAHVRLGVVLDHDDVAERLDLPASVRLREQPVLPGPGEVDVGDVDVGRVGLGAAGHADALELRGRLEEGLRLEPSGHPDPCLREHGHTPLGVDDEERDANVARFVARRPGDDRYVVARSTPELLESLAPSRIGTRGPVPTRTAAGGEEQTRRRGQSRSQAHMRPSLARRGRGPSDLPATRAP